MGVERRASAGGEGLSSGFDDTFFKANPIVTINHDYSRHPIGNSVWRVKLREGDRRGVKAKTHYPPRPAEWPEAEIWHPDAAWSLVKSGLMGGKSIGFITLKSHAPTDDEIKRRPELSKVRRIIDSWLLLEYCCCWMPVNPEAVVEAVAKSAVTPASLRAFGIEVPRPDERRIAFTPLAEVESAVRRALSGLDPTELTRRAVEAAADRARGRV